MGVPEDLAELRATLVERLEARYEPEAVEALVDDLDATLDQAEAICASEGWSIEPGDLVAWAGVIQAAWDSAEDPEAVSLDADELANLCRNRGR